MYASRTISLANKYHSVVDPTPLRLPARLRQSDQDDYTTHTSFGARLSRSLLDLAVLYHGTYAVFSYRGALNNFCIKLHRILREGLEARA